MTRGDAFAAAAEGMVGTPFRLHGRHPQLGLDCVGLIECALSKAGEAPVAPRFYALRNSDISAMRDCARQSGFETARGQPLRGDLILLRPGPAQHHLACVTANGRIVHAHAGLGRVTEQPLPAEWAMLGHWRLPSSQPEL